MTSSNPSAEEVRLEFMKQKSEMTTSGSKEVNVYNVVYMMSLNVIFCCVHYQDFVRCYGNLKVGK